MSDAKRTFDIHVSGVGDVAIEVKQSVIDELLGAEWESSYYSFLGERQAVEWLAWVITEWPPNYKGEYKIDGLVGFTEKEIKILKNELDYTIAWEDTKFSERDE